MYSRTLARAGWLARGGTLACGNQDASELSRLHQNEWSRARLRTGSPKMEPPGSRIVKHEDEDGAESLILLIQLEELIRRPPDGR